MRISSLLVVVFSAVLCLAVAKKFDPEALYGTNVHIVDQLDPYVQRNGFGLLRDLKYHELLISLRNPVQQGHSARFDLLHGDKGLLQSLAAKHHIEVNGDTLTFRAKKRAWVPKTATEPSVVDADDEAVATATSEEPAAAGHAQTVQELENENRKKIYRVPVQFDDNRKDWYHSNNLAQASKMDPVGRLYVENLINKLQTQDPNTVIQLMSPIRGGNAVRFLILAGNTDKMLSLANECHVVIKGDLITVPHVRARFGEHHTQADAAYVKGTEEGHLEANLVDRYPDSGTVIPHVVSGPTPKRVPSLPDKWIKNLP